MYKNTFNISNDIRIRRLYLGLAGDAKPHGEGVCELRQPPRRRTTAKKSGVYSQNPSVMRGSERLTNRLSALEGLFLTGLKRLNK